AQIAILRYELGDLRDFKHERVKRIKARVWETVALSAIVVPAALYVSKEARPLVTMLACMLTGGLAALHYAVETRRDARLRRAAITSIAASADIRTLTILADCSTDTDRSVSDTAVQGLKRLLPSIKASD